MRALEYFCFLNNKKVVKRLTIILIVVQFASISCKKLVDVNPPVTAITGASVYNSDATAISVMTGLYSQLSISPFSDLEGISSISLMAALSADELVLFDGSTNSVYEAYYKNSLSVTAGGFEYWNNLYPYIFICNSAIEGLTKSTSLTPSIKQQLIGEAKFMRAFFYFYLVNLYGDVPLILNSDWQINSSLIRTSSSNIYQQIINDLKDAQSLLPSNYVKADLVSSTTERVRPNKWAATAFLARAYLYYGNFSNAEEQATQIISNSSMYSLTSLNNTFLKNSSEAIWQLQPVISGQNTQDALFFVIPSTGPSDYYPVSISKFLLNSFDSNDLRKANWINSVNVLGVTYYYPYKYKVATLNSPVSEYQMVLRLGEQYLIRAEARAQQGNISGAESDLNVIRTRAGLTSIVTNDKSTLLSNIMHERQLELFTEWGHRWMDLKRANIINQVMDSITPQKGGAWNNNWQKYPIPTYDLTKNPNLVQNAGY